MGAEFVKVLVMWVWMSGFAAGVGAAPGDPETKAEPAGAELAGKVVALSMKNGSGCFLENIETRKLGSTTFLVGRIADNGTGQAMGVGSTLWICTDNITQMVEFKNLDEAKKIYRTQSASAPPGYPAPMPSPGVELARFTQAGSSPNLPPAPAASQAESISIIRQKSFEIPVLVVDPERFANVEKIRVYVSFDQGKTWHVHATADATAVSVQYNATGDGELWFALQLLKKDGKSDPPDEKGLVASSKVRVTLMEGLGRPGF